MDNLEYITKLCAFDLNTNRSSCCHVCAVVFPICLVALNRHCRRHRLVKCFLLNLSLMPDVETKVTLMPLCRPRFLLIRVATAARLLVIPLQYFYMFN